MARRRRGQAVNGWVLLDKPAGMTSTRAVSAIRRIFDAQKAGHAGTLDPLATGMLPIALGEATKTVGHVQDGAKTYRFTVRWGEERDTDDTEGRAVKTSGDRPAEGEITTVLPRFTGTIEQRPPAYSAIKVDGERAYDLARSGEHVELKTRLVHIDDLRIIEHPDDSHTVFEADCGKGTYIRALARDMGRMLGCFGHIEALRRLAVGPFGEDDMISLEKLNDLSHKGAGCEAMTPYLQPVETALDDIPALAIGGPEASRVKQGQSVILRGRDAPVHAPQVLVKWQGNPIAIATVEGGMLKPKRVFNL